MISQTTCCPSDGLVGLPRVRLPASVTRNLLPRLTSVATVAASVKTVTTPGEDLAMSLVASVTTYNPAPGVAPFNPLMVGEAIVGLVANTTPPPDPVVQFDKSAAARAASKKFV